MCWIDLFLHQDYSKRPLIIIIIMRYLMQCPTCDSPALSSVFIEAKSVIEAKINHKLTIAYSQMISHCKILGLSHAFSCFSSGKRSINIYRVEDGISCLSVQRFGTWQKVYRELVNVRYYVIMFTSILFKTNSVNLVDWCCRLHWLHLCRGVRLPRRVSCI